MKQVDVVFDGSTKIYSFMTNLDLIEGGKYNIIADYRTTYNNPVTVVGVFGKLFQRKIYGDLREITDARPVHMPRRPDLVKNIYINEEKRTVVVLWIDGTKTKVKCDERDTFDAEKGVAMCFMKKAYNNRGCFNETLKKYCTKGA